MGAASYVFVSGAVSTSPQYPTDGIGGATTTAGSSGLVNARVASVFQILITAVANGNIVIENHAGGGDIIIPVTTTTVVPAPICIGNDDGSPFTGGARFTASASGIDFYAFYDKII